MLKLYYVFKYINILYFNFLLKYINMNDFYIYTKNLVIWK